VVRIYKLSQNLETEEAEFELIQDDLVLNDSEPVLAWNSQTTLTEKGVLFFETHARGRDTLSIKLLNLDFESRSVETLHQFNIQQSKKCQSVYLLNPLSGKAVQFDSAEEFLQQNYFVVADGYGLSIRKLSSPSEVLHRIGYHLDPYKPPSVFRISKDC
jgi:hypothetical protein